MQQGELKKRKTLEELYYAAYPKNIDLIVKELVMIVMSMMMSMMMMMQTAFAHEIGFLKNNKKQMGIHLLLLRRKKIYE